MIYLVGLLLTVLCFPVHAMRALNTAATGMAVQEASVNSISQNIANANTIGYKRSRAESQDLLYETVQEAGARSSHNTRYNVGVQIGSGAKISSIRKEFSQGSPQVTDRPFDLMIDGSGFFGVLLPNGEMRFTRDGAFNVDSAGTLVTRTGYNVFPGISLPPNTMSINITEDGQVEAFVRNQVEPMKVGQIPVFTFINPVGLSSSGGNLYRATRASGEAIQNIPGLSNAGVVMQGALEASNVNIMNEMTELIRAQRAYETNSRVMGVADQMMQTVNNIR